MKLKLTKLYSGRVMVQNEEPVPGREDFTVQMTLKDFGQMRKKLGLILSLVKPLDIEYIEDCGYMKEKYPNFFKKLRKIRSVRRGVIGA